MTMGLAVGSGLFWTAAYLLVIRAGFRDRTYGMPLVALAANLAWEGIFSFVRPHQGVQHVIDLVWFSLDCVILWTAVRFGPREFPWLPRWGFHAGLAATLVLGYLGVDTVCRQFDGGHGTYAAFAQNLLMSGLFLGMLMARRSSAGQSLGIAVTKLVGTALASASSWLAIPDQPEHQGPLLPFLFLAVLLLDLVYTAALYAVGRAAVPLGADGAATAPRPVAQQP